MTRDDYEARRDLLIPVTGQPQDIQLTLMLACALLANLCDEHNAWFEKKTAQQLREEAERREDVPET